MSWTWFACSTAPAESVCSSESAIHGAETETVSALGSKASAIGALETASGQVKCSGFLVAPGWVLAAKHCRDEMAPLVRFAADGGRLRAAVSFEVDHKERDLLLVRLLDVDDEGPAPIALWPGPLGQDWLGREVILAGYGEDDGGARGRLRAVRERIMTVTQNDVTTDGDGRSGACRGDSGGPLLYEAPDGSFFSIGVLSRGDTDCKGVDVYTRVDDIAPWIEETQSRSEDAGCHGFSGVGTCQHHVALYCRDNQPVRDVCASPEICGWSRSEEGYRCVDEEDDPCQGTAAASRCDDDDLLTCEEGELRRTPCGPCSSCRSLPTGDARCE